MNLIFSNQVQAKIVSIPESHLLSCPSCGSALLKITSKNLEVIGGGYFLSDGDTISLEKNYEDSTFSFDASLVVGSRSCCHRSYYFIEFIYVDGQVDQDFKECWFYHNADPGDPTYYLASSNDQTWYVESYVTPVGRIFTHYIGPFPMSSRQEGSIIGPYGVSRCANTAGEDDLWSQSANWLTYHWELFVALARAGVNADDKITVLSSPVITLSK